MTFFAKCLNLVWNFFQIWQQFYKNSANFTRIGQIYQKFLENLQKFPKHFWKIIQKCGKFSKFLRDKKLLQFEWIFQFSCKFEHIWPNFNVKTIWTKSQICLRYLKLAQVCIKVSQNSNLIKLETFSQIYHILQYVEFEFESFV